ncbi:MAG: hypothetical protein RL076_434 [Chloroflexota bacterium]
MLGDERTTTGAVVRHTPAAPVVHLHGMWAQFMNVFRQRKLSCTTQIS